MRQAAAAGNASACVAAAEALDALGMPAEGAKFWGKAARAGSADGQVAAPALSFCVSCCRPSQQSATAATKLANVSLGRADQLICSC